ncbi:hypothetical protein SLNSH_22230 [Alsobacter soli]|uniref:SPOR domain-containing protein n=1 Tax=Alsobacter soli TaxID=2109933 RepID=A0A2T1HM92_9HYPH|nr:SPOR domain-containing protein [Alsobacter soli]PSC02767.1 hypothetical protein SLNSH_22230 [Alsobacter soli]
MNELNRQRPEIDLDELERQLREAAGPRASARPAPTRDHHNDPLAELARIVGQDDPFKVMWRDEAAGGRVEPRMTHEGGQQAAYPSASSFEDQLAAYEGDAQHGALPYQLRQPSAPDFEQQNWALRGEAQDDPRGYDDRYAQAEAEPVYEPQGQLPPHDESFDEPPRRSRKWALLAGVAACVALVGAGAYAFRGSSNVVRVAGAPPLIKADTGPSKVQPQNPGGAEVPNQDSAIYNRPGASEDLKNVKLSGRTEQPVDVEQLTRRDLPADAAPNPGDATSTGGPAAARPAAPPSGLPQLGEPRRVKTVSVRPDGTVIDNEPAPTRVASLAAVAPSGPAPSASATPSSTGATPAPVARPKPTPSAPPTTAAIAPKPKPEAAPATPAAAAAPKPAPARQQVASTQPSAPVAEAASGGFAVQLAAPQSESEARDVIGKLQKRFASQLDGHTPGVRKADVNGKTIYRVRVGGLSREDATALCTKLQGAGGQCFVAKN